MNFEIKQLIKNKMRIDSDITIKGWVRSNRSGKNIGFIDINDGSCLSNLQVVYHNDNTNWNQLSSITTGSAIIVTGNLIESKIDKQKFELQLKSLDYLNIADFKYPIQKKAHSYDFLREYVSLRARTNTFYAVFKIRNQLAQAIHNFFQNENFIYLNSPIITDNDAEGAGENFIVTTITNDQYENDFFGKKASLTVSGQLNAEAYAQAFKKVYTFGPTFRAENSNTTRHAAEFWMIEPEVAFADTNANINLAKNLIVSVINNLLENCSDELTFLNQKLAKENNNHLDLFEKLKPIQNQDNFKTITYTEAIEKLKQAQLNGKKFIFDQINWGINLQSEHERYLCEELFKCPIFVINYPQAIKAFYMKVNENSENNRKTVAAMDLLVPGIGELIGGSVREDNYELLVANKTKFGITNEDLQWYFDLRKFGYAPSAGFGLGFERLIMFVTGMTNIRDVIPFPRTPNNLVC